MKRLIKRLAVKENLVHLIPRLLIILIVGQTLPFKFLGAEESIFIFSQLGMEPYGRILVGTLEFIAIIFLLTRFYAIGAYITSAVVGVASILHVVQLGIEIQNDGGLLFILSIIVNISSLWLIVFADSLKHKSRLVIKPRKRKSFNYNQ